MRILAASTPLSQSALANQNDADHAEAAACQDPAVPDGIVKPERMSARHFQLYRLRFSAAQSGRPSRGGRGSACRGYRRAAAQ